MINIINEEGEMMDLKWLKTFITVYECGNFRVAAEKLFISQPSISVHIKLLEEDLNVPLFARNHTQVTLTKEGEYFYSLAKNILDKVEENKRLLRSYAKNSKVQLAVALSPLLVTTKIPQYLYEFMQRFPHYEIDIVIEESDQIDELIRSNKVQLAIGMNNRQYKDIHAERLFSSLLELVYPPSFEHNELQITPLLTSLLQQYPMFVGHLDAINPIISYIEKEHQITRKSHIKQSDVVKQLILRGLGIGFLPRFQIEDDLAKGNLRSVDLQSYTRFYPIEIYMKHLRESEQLMPLLHFMREKYYTTVERTSTTLH